MLLFTIISLLSLAVAGRAILERSDGKDNYATLTEVMGKISPVKGKKYAIYEYRSGTPNHTWCNGLLNKLGHVALVVGEVRDGRGGLKFIATAYELSKSSSTWSQIIPGFQVWHRNASLTYKYAGEIMMSTTGTALEDFGTCVTNSLGIMKGANGL